MRRNFLASLALTAAVGLLAAAEGASAQQVLRLPSSDQPLRAREQALFRIGAEEGQRWEVFSNVAGVAFDGADNLYVFDRGNSRVVVFGPSGRFIREIGRRGSGPGEFSVPLQMAVTRDGQVVVSDAGRSAFHLFRPNGSFQESVPHARQWGIAGLGLQPHPSGGVVTLAQTIPGSRQGQSANPIVWYPLRPNATVASLYAVPHEPPPSSGQRSAGGGRLLLLQKPAFSPETRFRTLPGGELAISHTAGYAIKIVTPSGQVARVLERPIQPRRVTSADREREIRRRRDDMASGRGLTTNAPVSAATRADVAERALQNLEFADVFPVVQNLAADPSGRLWIQRTGSQPGGPGPIDVVTPGGRYLGTLGARKLPVAFGRDGRVAYIEKDGLGVERVVVSRISIAPR